MIRICTALTLIMLAAALMMACRSDGSTDLQSEVKPVPTFTATLFPTARATVAPIQVPTATPTPVPSATFAPTQPATATSTATPVISPTLIPMSDLSITPEESLEESDKSESQTGVVHPSVNTMADKTFVGEFHNLEANWNGQIHLEVQGNTVYSSLQSVRSPVQYFARQQPEVLFTVPEGFRPAVTITWEVNGQPVGTNGQLDPALQNLWVFRLQVDKDGHVRYVDDPGVDGVGFLRYHTALAWPLAGTDPEVCARSWASRSRILAALAKLEGHALTCDQVGWEHLTRIRTWSSQELVTIQRYYQRPVVWQWLPKLETRERPSTQHSFENLYLWPPLPFWNDNPPISREFLSIKPGDLLGLTNLTELQIEFGERSPLHPRLLAHTPRLTSLSVAQEESSGRSNMVPLPEDFLAYTPILRRLSLGRFSDDILADWTASTLGQTPHLTSLSLELRKPTVQVSNLLHQSPRLNHLSIHGLDEPLSEDFLAEMPNLSNLSVAGTFNPCEIPVLRLPTSLTEFALRIVVEGYQVKCFANSWIVQAGVVTELRVALHGLGNIESHMLPLLPTLTHLTVDVGNITLFPSRLLPRLLENVPNLTRLHLHQGQEDPRPIAQRDSSLFSLPGSLLAGTPNLIELSLELPYRVHELPAELLAPVPSLKRFRLHGLRLKTIPHGMFDSQHQLTDVSIELCDLDVLPEDFLVHTGHLRSLFLGTNSYGCYSGLERPGPKFLPAHFLSYTPQLTHLWLGFKALEELPPSFLAHVPRLQHLELEYSYGKHGKYTYALDSLPAGFLENSPNLTYLDLWPIVKLTALPKEFLRESARLKYLYLDANGVSTLPINFLTQTPQLKLLELDARNVVQLPQGFLFDTPQLSYLMLDVNQVDLIADGFLSNVPRLGYLDMRAENLTELPEGFLAQSPRLTILGLGMPNLETPPSPGDALWETLKATSVRVKVIETTKVRIEVEGSETYCQSDGILLEPGQILEVTGRELDDEGNTLLHVYHWHTVGLFFNWYERGFCNFPVDARYTEPTLDV